VRAHDRRAHFDEALPRRELARERSRVPKDHDATTISHPSQPDLLAAATTAPPAHKDPKTSASLPPSIASLPSRGEDGRASHSSGRGADEYLGMIRRRISKKKMFPAEALTEGMRGTSLVGFRLHRNGTVSGVRIVRGSRSPILDSEAQMTVRRAAPFPPIPDRFSGNSMDLQVPISFEIENR
jgi:protein TonB